jgi:inorganic pyrophosphatase
MIYPGDYGLIPQTHYDDGDPLDVLVLINEPTFTGCLVEARPVGIFRMLDKGEADDKILCVPRHNPFFSHIRDLKDVPPHFLKEVAHFFAVYKDLEGSRTLTLGWEGVETAHKQIMHSIELYKDLKAHAAREEAEARKDAEAAAAPKPAARNGAKPAAKRPAPAAEAKAKPAKK